MMIIALFCLSIMASRVSGQNQCPEALKGCIYNKQAYRDGTYTFSCFTLVCRGGSWQHARIDPKCAMCYTCNDPHFKTFDNTYYDWHGKCNYTMSQPYKCGDICTYNPQTAVYADFGFCSPGSAISCVEYTTYKVDPFTAVSITHSQLPSNVVINGNTITVPLTPTAFQCFGNLYPVLIWRDGTGCVYIIGPTYTVKVCGWCIYIYYNKSAGPVGGLCGYYTGDGIAADDFMIRNGNCTSTTSIPHFAASWATQEQEKNCCDQDQLNQPRIIDLCDKTLYNDYLNKCKATVTEQMRAQGCQFDGKQIDITKIIEDCAEDCCANPNEVDRWIQNARNIIRALCDDESKKKSETIAS